GGGGWAGGVRAGEGGGGGALRGRDDRRRRWRDRRLGGRQRPAGTPRGDRAGGRTALARGRRGGRSVLAVERSRAGDDRRRRQALEHADESARARRCAGTGIS